jgi:hypothetical protein
VRDATFYQWLSLAAAVVAVPVIGFWLTLRQDSVRWYREQRADLYVDLLVEADAERNFMLWQFGRREMAEIDRQYEDDRRGPSAVEDFDRNTAGLPDTRLPPYERARLGARANAYASIDVIRLFNELQRIGHLGTLGNATPPLVDRARAETAFDALQDQIKRELRKYGSRIERRRESRPPSP